MAKDIIHSNAAPAAVGPYSQAVKTGHLIFTAGQIPLDPATMELVPGGFTEQVEQVFKNLAAVAQAAGGTLNHAVKLTCYLTDLTHTPALNAAIERHLAAPFPARTTIGIAALPKGALVEVEAVLALD